MIFDYHTYFKFLTKEILNLQVYINATLVGTIICYLISQFSPIPYIVPLIVQILVRSNVKFRQRHQDALVELPAQTGDPSFIMDMDGNIILSIGKTLDLFKRFGIRNIKEFINESAFNKIVKISFSTDISYAADNRTEAFSNKSLKWYEIKAQATGIKYGDKSQKILVWFQDISQRKAYQLRLRDLMRYSDSLMDSLSKPLKPGMEYEILAVFLLKEYGAAFITRADGQDNLKGYSFKKEQHTTIRSELITVSNQSMAPINISRKERQILSDEASFYTSEELFLKQHPFDPAVLNFIGEPIRNFITYNEADISIIAFNFRSQITTHEKDFFEVLVNIYRNMMVSVDLKRALQKNNKD